MLVLNRNQRQKNLRRVDVLVATKNPVDVDALAPNPLLRLAKVFKQEAL
jgi:hypothetical protein